MRTLLKAYVKEERKNKTKEVFRVTVPRFLWDSNKFTMIDFYNIALHSVA